MSTPPTILCPVLQSAKPCVKIQPPEDLNLLPTTDNNIFTSRAQDDNSNHSSDNAKPEVGLSPTTNNQNMPWPIPSNSPAVCLSYYSHIYLMLCLQSTISPINLIQAYLAQLSGTSTPALPVQVSTILPSHTNQLKKSSKGIKAYPDGWQTMLNTAKDVIHRSVSSRTHSLAPTSPRLQPTRASMKQLPPNVVIMDSFLSLVGFLQQHCKKTSDLSQKHRIFLVWTDGSNCECLFI